MTARTHRRHTPAAVQQAQAHLAGLDQGAGVPIVKRIILPDEFLAWSKANRKGVGTTDRAEFAAWKSIQAEEVSTRR